MDSSIWLVVVLVTALAGLIRGFTGFGGALVMTPVFLTWFDPVSTTVIVVLVNVVAGALQAPQIYREADRPLAVSLCLTGMVFAPLGLWAVQVLPLDWMQQIIGAVVLVMTIALLTGWQLPVSIRQPAGKVILGGTSGFFFGMGGIGGPPVVLGLLAERVPPRSARATQLAYFSVIQVFVLLVFGLQGLIQSRDWMLGAILSVVYTLAGIGGGYFLTDARERVFRSVSILVLLSVALYALLGRS